MRASNTAIFIVVNWVFLVVLAQMIYRIRNIQDETLIKQECVAIIGSWISLCFL